MQAMAARLRRAPDLFRQRKALASARCAGSSASPCWRPTSSGYWISWASRGSWKSSP